jgi:hypothetical protein
MTSEGNAHGHRDHEFGDQDRTFTWQLAIAERPKLWVSIRLRASLMTVRATAGWRAG